MSIGPAFRFYCLQLRQFQPVLFAALLVSIAAFVFSTGGYLLNMDRLQTEQDALALQSQPVQAPAGSAAAVKPIALPPFDPVILVSAIEQEAVSTKVSTDTFTFALEDGAGLPYRRYRANFSMLGRYPQIRAAIASVLKKVPYSSLDSIKCTREDISEVEVNCTISMSAFYQRPSVQ